MDPEHVPGAILLTLTCVIGALGMWYFGLQRGSLKRKQCAVMIGVLPVLGVGLILADSWFGWDGPAEYRTSAVGPARREAITTDEIRVPVTNATVEHELELGPKIRGANPPIESVHLRFKVRSPTGDILTSGEQDLAPGTGLRWVPLRAQFRPHEEGEHTLILDVPQPISSVDVIVRELRK